MPAKHMESNKGLPDAQTIALQVVVWMLSESRRAERLLAVTGLDADALRDGIGDDAVLGAVLDHLANYEPDLLACADDLGCSPAAIVDAQRSLAA
ncbi:DUF3572 domain-containing protein [Sphingobium sp. SCG-1]|uniref:DUF3572 family protein n=1 Tax=Sphingobium sp. SCG-1 TaxID=2072936 RepID=UPI000CD6B4DA|nr:DUF3572 family protein [Sphingobium sp. SCG-1]AUW56849.1 DUF3572 domain-containing protein [Sphingobium sp. SCG-1]